MVGAQELRCHRDKKGNMNDCIPDGGNSAARHLLLNDALNDDVLISIAQ